MSPWKTGDVKLMPNRRGRKAVMVMKAENLIAVRKGETCSITKLCYIRLPLDPSNQEDKGKTLAEATGV